MSEFLINNKYDKRQPMNVSLILNGILFISVLAILFKLLRKKETDYLPQEEKPSLNTLSTFSDDIISVRKINLDEPSPRPKEPVNQAQTQTPTQPQPQPSSKTIMILLVAKPDRYVRGYEMLQTLLSAGLRFGEGQLFHYHQDHNGHGPVLCSLAAATPTGTFDLQNIGAFNTKGLYLFMHLSQNTTLDMERLDKMIELAQQLSEGLDTFLLDEHRKPFTSETKVRYRHILESNV